MSYVGCDAMQAVEDLKDLLTKMFKACDDDKDGTLDEDELNMDMIQFTIR